MRTKAAAISYILTAFVSGGVAIVLLLGTMNGLFAAFYNNLLTMLGSSTGQTTSVRPVVSYTGGGGSSTASNNATTTSATISSVTANWAGYVASGGTYTGITGSWTVPTASATASNLSADATWIGIGGSGTSDLIQIGTENIVQNGQVQLVAFYEELPEYAHTIESMTLSPGDSVTATLSESSTDVWVLSLSDTTSGQKFETTVRYASTNASAEWIQEAPSTASGIMDLDNFGTVSFSGATVTVNGTNKTLSGSGAEAITMENGAGQQLTSVSDITEDGSGFSVTRTSASGETNQSGTGIRRREPGLNRFNRQY